MSKIARLALGNPLYHARMRAAKNNPALASREYVAEITSIPLRRLLNLETGREVPRMDEISIFEKLYDDPKLRFKYCLCSCPFGVYGLDGIRKARASG